MLIISSNDTRTMWPFTWTSRFVRCSISSSCHNEHWSFIQRWWWVTRRSIFQWLWFDIGSTIATNALWKHIFRFWHLTSYSITWDWNALLYSTFLFRNNFILLYSVFKFKGNLPLKISLGFFNSSLYVLISYNTLLIFRWGWMIVCSHFGLAAYPFIDIREINLVRVESQFLYFIWQVVMNNNWSSIAIINLKLLH